MTQLTHLALVATGLNGQNNEQGPSRTSVQVMSGDNPAYFVDPS